MGYKVEGPRPKKKEKAVRLGDLAVGEIGVITEDCDDFGKVVFMTRSNDDSGQWAVCLDDATVGRNLGNPLCRLIKRGKTITITMK